ncbi:ROK family protein [Streptomyces bohaiensis]|uniref:ROK family protein n=1 Tax=Streptomyces bohaiensis TaxID=1431344 RepID=UPI0030C690F9
MNQGSAGRLLQLIRSGRATTRGELRRVTSLSRSTVGARLDQLFAAGWVREAAAPAGASTGGRPALRLEFDTSHAVVLAADLDTRHARVAVTDLGGTVLAERTADLVVEDGPGVVLPLLARLGAAVLGDAERPAHAVCGVGLAVPGPVDDGRLVQPPIMPGWDGHPVAELLGARLAEEAGTPADLPVLVENDANLMAYAEQRHGHPDCSAFLLVKVATGIGAGLVVDGGMYRGVDGGAGDIGHIRLADASDALCRCGSYGCLAAVASGRALAEQLTALGVTAGTAAEVRALLADGRPEAVRLARDAGRRVGEVLATVVSLINPGVLMIAGDLAGPPFLTGVRELLYQRAMPRTTVHLQMVTSRLGERAGLLGAATMVVDLLYGAERADARLAAAAAEAAARPGVRAAG